MLCDPKSLQQQKQNNDLCFINSLQQKKGCSKYPNDPRHYVRRMDPEQRMDATKVRFMVHYDDFSDEPFPNPLNLCITGILAMHNIKTLTINISAWYWPNRTPWAYESPDPDTPYGIDLRDQGEISLVTMQDRVNREKAGFSTTILLNSVAAMLPQIISLQKFNFVLEAWETDRSTLDVVCIWSPLWSR